jgi:two-component system, OmpR family, sensor histidine kinase BaeS
MRRSFAVRLAVAFAAVGLAAAAVTALLVNVAFGSRFTGYLQAQQDERLGQLITTLEDAYAEAGRWDPQQLHRITTVALMDGGTLVLSDPDGGLVWESRADPTAEAHRQMMGTGPLGEQRQVPVEVDGTVVGVAAVRLPQAGLLPQDVTFRASVNRMILVGALVAGVAALLLGLLLARRTTAPARALTRTATVLAAGERSARVPDERADEFGEMARAFNRMAAAVEEEDRLRRGFAADVAHELRTPLMILRGEIEALEDGITAATPEALASLREETLRLARLVDDLETLARADAAGFSLDRRPTDLAALVSEAAGELAPAFAERDITLEQHPSPPVPSSVDPVRVKQIVVNLLSNAAKFTPESGLVRLRVEQHAAETQVAVWNSGPGIPPDDLAHVFERFYRGRQPHSSGSGIGLTVARDLAEAHGGTIEVTSHPQAGTSFLLRLPSGAPASWWVTDERREQRVATATNAMPGST